MLLFYLPDDNCNFITKICTYGLIRFQKQFQGILLSFLCNILPSYSRVTEYRC